MPPQNSTSLQRRRSSGPTAIQLCEEAVHLLRNAPAGVIALYFAGSIAFWLGFLYFWADMSRDPTAEARSGEASLAVALLFLLMRVFHALAAERLRGLLGGKLPEQVTMGRCFRLACLQAFFHGLSFFVLPLAALITLPLGYAIAYFQSVTVLGAAGTVDSARSLHRRAVAQAVLWPGSAHILLVILFLLALVVFLNVVAALLLLPYLLRILTGTETVFTQSGFGIVNSTLFLSVCALTHMCVDPLLKAAYVLRCFYGEAQTTGEDILVQLRGSVRRGTVERVLSTGVLLLVLGCAPATASGEPAAPAVPAGQVSPTELNRAMDEVLERREFRWRMPREAAPESETQEGWFAEFLVDAGYTIRELLKSAGDAVGRFLRWLYKAIFGGSNPAPTSGASFDWQASLYGLAILLLLFLAPVVGVYVYRTLQRKRAKVQEAVEVTALKLPDLAHEEITADELPEDGWLLLAKEMADRGELRLAIRALYLASLAVLARNGVLAVARYKSNREYEREVGRRAHSRPELVRAFAQNVALFDRSWYGAYEVTRETLDQYYRNLQVIQSVGHSS